MAETGQAGTQAPQSMHSTGSMKSCSASPWSASSFLGWMQSTGQASTQAVSFVPIQGSAMTYAMSYFLRRLQRFPHYTTLTHVLSRCCRIEVPPCETRTGCAWKRSLDADTSTRKYRDKGSGNNGTRRQKQVPTLRLFFCK